MASKKANLPVSAAPSEATGDPLITWLHYQMDPGRGSPPHMTLCGVPIIHNKHVAKGIGVHLTRPLNSVDTIACPSCKEKAAILRHNKAAATTTKQEKNNDRRSKRTERANAHRDRYNSESASKENTRRGQANGKSTGGAPQGNGAGKPKPSKGAAAAAKVEVKAADSKPDHRVQKQKTKPKSAMHFNMMCPKCGPKGFFVPTGWVQGDNISRMRCTKCGGDFVPRLVIPNGNPSMFTVVVTVTEDVWLVGYSTARKGEEKS